MEQNNVTEINSAIHGNVTEVNSEIQGETPSFTVVNPTVRNYSVDIPAGTILADRYVIDEPLSTNSGEANLYLCTYQDERYVAKVYRRQSAVKENIVVALESIDSPYVAKLYATGVWNGSPFEILPYYKFGSLEGKTFDFECLRKDIIPALNEGIKVLHDRDIIHKDLKPSNIMLCDDQKNVAIIDFGISSIREGGSTVVVTKTGMTPEYSAPETFRNLYLEESDYYSLGITLYELYTGHTPYAGLSKDVIEQYISIQKVPFPDAFPPELKQLVTGLTYNDITNRKDKSNPNRRWTYNEVVKWCNGEQLELPGGNSEQTAETESAAMPPFRFQYKKYTRVGELAEALGADWANGKKRLYRSLLTEHFRSCDPEIANYCIDAEEAVQKTPSRSDIEFFCLLYRMYPQMTSFNWLDYHFANMKELGKTMLEGLRSNSGDTFSMIDIFVENHLFSEREKIVSRNTPERADSIAAIETTFLLAKREENFRTQMEQAYILAYLYSKSKELVVSCGTFDSIDSLTSFTKKLLSDSPDKIDTLSKELMQHVQKVKYKTKKEYVNVSTDLATPQFAAWLYIQGKSNILDY